MRIAAKIAKTLRKPASIPYVAKNLILEYYKVYVIRDSFAVSWSNWFRDKGDTTLRLDYPLNHNSFVVDLGGYKGDFAFEINKRYGCHVEVYEPVKTFCAQCVQRFVGNPKVVCHNYGLSDAPGQVYISNEDNGSSIVRRKTPTDELIVVKSFREEFERLGISTIDLLKMNVEGSEFLLLPHIFETDLIRRIKYLQIQFHTFFPDAVKLRESIRSRLAMTHVEEWNYPFAYESWRLRSL